MDYSYEKFCEDVKKGKYCFEFIYNQFHIHIGTKERGRFKRIPQWFFIVNRHDNTADIINATFESAEVLLLNSRIEGNSLEKIWSELVDATI